MAIARRLWLWRIVENTQCCKGLDPVWVFQCLVEDAAELVAGKTSNRGFYFGQRRNSVLRHC